LSEQTRSTRIDNTRFAQIKAPCDALSVPAIIVADRFQEYHDERGCLFAGMKLAEMESMRRQLPQPPSRLNARTALRTIFCSDSNCGTEVGGLEMCAPLRYMAVVFLPIALSTSGCRSECNDIWDLPAYHMTVLDSMTKTPICDADVTVNGRPARRSSIDCGYVLEIPSGDTATIATQHGGYRPMSLDVSTRYSSDTCGHAVPVSVTVQLDRN